MDRVGDLKLTEFFFWRGIWKKVQWADEADFLFHMLEHSICWSDVKDKLVNKVPGVTFLSGKQEHAYAFNKFAQLHNLTQDDLRFPETFILPEDLKLYLETHRVLASHQKHKDRVYLSKQNSGSQGSGIQLITSPNQLVVTGDDLIVQQYINNPFLIRGLKHDMRLYVTLTSVEPLTAYISSQGLVRFCTEPYQEPNAENRIKSNMHLSNYSLNKNSKDYVFTDSIEGESDGSKQTLSSYLKSLPNPDQVWESIKELIQKSLKALEPFLRYFLRCQYPRSDHGKMFHIIGYDIMLDSEMRPYIIELNANPSLNIQFEGNEEVKEKAGFASKTPKKPARDKTVKPAKAELPRPKISFGSRQSHNPKERSHSQTIKQAESKARIPLHAYEKLPSTIEEVEVEEDSTVGGETTAPSALSLRYKKYLKFRDAQDEKNDARKIQRDVDPICMVDLHVKST
jgi:hypothetical protein